MILYRYILKNHIVPFIFSAASLMLIFILQFLMKFSDRLVGKGLDTWVIIKLIGLNLAWMVVLVIPMASLVASLMAFGSMSQNNEVTIMKSSGVSLFRMLTAPIIAGIAVAYLLFLFNDDVLPDANHEAKILMQDISRQKPTLSLVPNVFSQEVANYAILVRDINKKTNELKNVLIYDYTDPTKINVVTAQEGKIFFSRDQTKLIMDLRSGEIHESNAGATHMYRKLIFTKHRIAMDAEQFTFQQSSPGTPRGERELSTGDMQVIVDSLEKTRDQFIMSASKEAERYMLFNSNTPYSVPAERNVSSLLYTRVLEKAKAAKNAILSNYKRIDIQQSSINNYAVEIHKKYSLPVACIIFVLIGAPLGIMVRKGGFGVAASISLFFFLIYWAFLIGGEKLSDRNFLSPFWGMWSANIVLGVLGIILFYRSLKESTTISFAFFRRFIPKQWREIDEQNNETN